MKYTFITGGLVSLSIVLAILRMCDIITISWWWILFPIYGPIAAGFITLLVVGLVCGYIIFRNTK